jgi:hypothetical protein
MERNAIKFSIRLAPQVYEALRREAQQQGREVGELTQRILTRHAIDAQLLDQTTVDDHEARQRLIDRAVEVALRLKRDEGIARDIINKVFLAGMADEAWLGTYAAYAGGDPFQHNNPKKSSLNREIGMRIRRAIGGRVAMFNGKAIKTLVRNSIIQMFTEMEPEPKEEEGLKK